VGHDNVGAECPEAVGPGVVVVNHRPNLLTAIHQLRNDEAAHAAHHRRWRR
jgi:hypothetical protein